VQTDSILIARLASEIDDRFRDGRVQDAGQLEDGRFALLLWKKGVTKLLCADLFAPTPLMTVEDGDLPIAAEPGFVRAAGAALRGKTLSAARALEGERILELDFAAQSRFGVPETYVLIYELVPRFGNLVLAKGDVVVAALKEFRRTGKASRTVRAGIAYEPPLPRAGKSRLLPSAGPEMKPVLTDELYVYRDAAGGLLQAHVVPLEQFAESVCERAPSLLGILAELRVRGGAQPVTQDDDKVRADAGRSLEERERKLRAELARVEGGLAEAASRDYLRARGDAIYARLHELSASEQAAAKEEAASLFARYKKAGSAAAHLTRRRTSVRQSLEETEELRWELERADHDQVREIMQLVKPRRASAGAPKSRPRKRAPLQAVTPNGSRILVGRSPLENAELTFRVASPRDLWFHARGQPGAHVILQRDDRAEPNADDIRAAAELAALYSKGRNSSKVSVDYTQRKHVRKRPNAAPGLVFYTNASSLTVEPRDSMNIASPKEKKR